jgi:hypothetical protein
MKKIVLLAVLAALLLALIPLGASAAPTCADPAIQSTWERTDKPIDDAVVSRTWMWGPAAFFTGQEPYAQSPSGSRLVQYFDKSRMEITDPNGDSSSDWFVTNGLLVNELITGQMQLGDSTFELREPANIPVAGDPTNPWPTYASLGRLLGIPAPDSTGQYVTTVFLPEGSGDNAAAANDPNARLVYFEPSMGHNIPGAFWDFLNSAGTMYENGAYVTANLCSPTFYATGLPITEAYWAQVSVNGVTKSVLFQAFERRVLTYTPDNPEGWKVEMGNVGQHYYLWRYGVPQLQPEAGNYTGPAQNLILQGSDISGGYDLWESKGLDLSSTPVASSGWSVSYVSVNPLKTALINNEVLVFPTLDSATTSFDLVVQGVDISDRVPIELGQYGDQTVAFSGSRDVDGVSLTATTIVFRAKNVISTIVMVGRAEVDVAGDAATMAVSSYSGITASPTVP